LKTKVNYSFKQQGITETGSLN